MLESIIIIVWGLMALAGISHITKILICMRHIIPTIIICALTIMFAPAFWIVDVIMYLGSAILAMENPQIIYKELEEEEEENDFNPGECD